ncbi:MAG: NUDIX hydrolase [Wenzhouxiangellaceae bacterium]
MPLKDLLAEYARRHPGETATADRFAELLESRPDCFSRSCVPAHLTASAWIVDPARRHVMLTHHRKLGRWLQPGGHCDGDPHTLGVAIRETLEETGLTVDPVSEAIFDLDIHRIPARGVDPGHWHYDVRFALQARHTHYVVSSESHDLAWVPMGRLQEWSREPSLHRMARKWFAIEADG